MTGGGDSLRAHLRRMLSDADLLGGRVLAGVSGGADSLALLELLADLHEAGDLEVVVGHVEHGIHPASREGARLVAARASVRGLLLEQVTLQLGPSASETVARRARRRALGAMRRAVGASAIVLAHHAEDQAETVLQRLAHGTAPLGLAAMQLRRGVVVRPLLAIPRAALTAECARRCITPWQDPANGDLRHERAWVRAALLPLMLAREPQMVQRLGQVAAHARAEAGAWHAVLRQLPELAFDTAPDGTRSVVAPVLGRYDSGLACALLRALASEIGCVLGPRRAEQVRRWLAGAVRGGWLSIGGEWRAELVRGRVTFRRVRQMSVAPIVIGAAEQGRAGVAPWSVRWWQHEASGRDAPLRTGAVQDFAVGAYLMRPHAPGDRIVPLGGSGSRRVGRCLQDAGISGGRRSGWPVLVYESEVVWVIGVCRGAGRLPSPGMRSVRVAVEHC